MTGARGLGLSPRWQLRWVSFSGGLALREQDLGRVDGRRGWRREGHGRAEALWGRQVS